MIAFLFSLLLAWPQTIPQPAGAGVASTTAEAAQAQLQQLWQSSTQLYKEKQYKESGQSLRQFVDQAKAQGLAAETAQGAFRLGYLADLMGDFPAASEAYKLSYQLWQQQGEQSSAAKALFNLAGVEMVRGSYDRAREAYDGLYKLYDRAQQPELAARSQLNRGTVLWRLGAFDLAEADLKAASDQFKTLNKPIEEAQALSNLAQLYRSRGNRAQALKLLQAAQAAIPPASAPEVVAGLMNNIAELYVQDKQYQEALPLLNQALELKRKHCPPAMVATGLQTIGDLRYRLGSRAEGDMALEESLRLLEQAGDTLGQAESHLLLGRWLIVDTSGQTDAERRTNAEQSLVHLNRSLELVAPTGAREELYRIYYWRARCYQTLGRTAEADEAYRLALQLREQLFTSLAEAAPPWEEEDAYVAYIAFLLDQQKVPEALAVLERSQRKSLQEALLGKQQLASAPNQELSALRDKLQVAQMQKDATLTQVLSQNLQVTQERYGEFVEQLFKEDPKLAASTQVRPDTLRRLRTRLEPDMVLLEYLLSDARLYIFVVSTDSEQYRTVEVPRKAVENLVSYLRDLMQLSFEAYPPVQSATAVIKLSSDYQRFMGEPMRQTELRLAELLIKPVQDLIKGKQTLVILPNGKLHYLPFSALRLPAEGDQPERYLLEDYALLKQGNDTLLDFARQKAQVGSATGPTILAVGNADGSLPSAEWEVQQVAKDFPGCQVWLRGEATESKFKAQAGNFQWVHLATHAMLDAAHKDATCVILAPDTAHGEDGRLTRPEIKNLDLLHTDLVTLSACETALGEEAVGDEILGLEESFVYAGAQTVISTLWPIEDRATGELMSRFYANLRSGHKLAALRQAQLSLLHSPGYAHPYFWSAFVMVGAW